MKHRLAKGGFSDALEAIPFNFSDSHAGLKDVSSGDQTPNQAGEGWFSEPTAHPPSRQTPR